MSLSVLAVKNVYHKNGKSIFLKQEFGGLQKCSIEPLDNKDTMQSESKEESIQTNSITWDNRSSTDGFPNTLILLTWLVFIRKSIRVMVLDIIVRFLIYPGTYEMYRDFQENTINSDGAFGMWFVVFTSFYLAQ